MHIRDDQLLRQKLSNSDRLKKMANPNQMSDHQKSKIAVVTYMHIVEGNF